MENQNIGMKDTQGKSNFYRRQPEPFDWYQIYTGIKDVITQYISKNHRVLNIGAGNSSNKYWLQRTFRRHVRRRLSKYF